MNGHVNLTAYDVVENLSSFTEANFQKYCQAELVSCD